MTDPTGDALRANEKVVEAVAWAIAESLSEVLSAEDGYHIHPDHTEAARAAISAYEQAMKA